MIRILFSACKQAQPLVNFQGALKMDPLRPWRQKEKVVIVMGATGTGKTRLAVDLATRFPAEIVNSDKMQVYKGLDIVTNKVTEEECCGVPHHLLGIADPNSNFTAIDFRYHASLAVESIVKRKRLPIIAGGSNSYIEALVNDDVGFRSKYECCFLWVDVSLSVLHSFVSERVDRMVEAGLVDEVRGMFDPAQADYSRGIRRAIGVPELDQFLRWETTSDDKTRALLLEEAIDKIKKNTCDLAYRQLEKIMRQYLRGWWNLHRLDATKAFQLRGGKADEAWQNLVAGPSTMIVDQFLDPITAPDTRTVIAPATIPMTAVAAATHWR